MTQNAHLNIDILKKEWGFSGHPDVRLDVDLRRRRGVPNGGLDIEMPSGLHLNREKLLPQSSRVWFLSPPSTTKFAASFASQLSSAGSIVNKKIWRFRATTAKAISRARAARESAVLLKNEGNLLPLKKEPGMSVLVVGPDAYPAVPVGGGSAQRRAIRSRELISGHQQLCGETGKVFYSPGLPTVAGNGRHNTPFFTTASRRACQA